MKTDKALERAFYLSRLAEHGSEALAAAQAGLDPDDVDAAKRRDAAFARMHESAKRKGLDERDAVQKRFGS